VEIVRASGLEIAYERVGAGPPLVLVTAPGMTTAYGSPQLSPP
jgi:hypothetical protein